MPYQLRPVAEFDYEWLYELKREAYKDVVTRQFGSWDESEQRAMFKAAWLPEISRIVVVDGVDVGLIAVEEREDSIWLQEIQLRRNSRGSGLGTELIRARLADARARSVPLRLHCAT